MLKVRVGYPTRDAEKEIVARMASGRPIEVQRVAEADDILAARSAIAELFMDQKVVDYIVDVVRGTREPQAIGLSELKPLIAFGASPRASRHSRSAPPGQGHRAPHTVPGQLALHGGIPVDVPRTGHRVRGGARVPAGGRLPRDRLERVGADGPPVREDVPRRTREHAAPRGGSVGLVPVRAPLHQGGPRGGGRGRAGAGGGAPQRPGGRADVRRQSRVGRATRQGSAARAARDPRPGGVHAARAGHEPGGGVELRGEAAAAPRDRGRPVGLSGRWLGGPPGAARRAPRCRRHHHRRPARTPAPRCGLGRHGGCRDRPAGPPRHEPRGDADARGRGGRAPASRTHPEAGPSGRGPRGAPDQRPLRRSAAPRLRRARPPAEAMKPRCTTLRRHVARDIALTAALAILGVVASWRRGTAQTATWTASPPAPTVGDTIWLERALAVPSGWQVRAGKLEATEAIEPLADPAVRRSPGGWVVRYAVVAWTPGAHKLALPPVWLLGPDGRADSTAGGTTSFSVTSVIPDSLRSPSPQGLLAPLRELRDLLEQLDRVAFASAHGTDVAALSAMARRLARELTP